MLQLTNETPFVAELFLLPDIEGVDTVYSVAKGTFILAPGLSPADQQSPVNLTDQHYGDPGTSSVSVPSDLVLAKPGTDVLVQGSAWAPRGRAITELDVSLEVGPVRKRVRVFGDRFWTTSPMTTISRPQPFTHMPLKWELAYGGTDTRSEQPRVSYAEPRNPIGTGFRVAAGEQSEPKARLPNLEDPMNLIRRVDDRPMPAAFGPISPQWEPRRTYAGTYDQAWMETGIPYVPRDFDPRFFHCAPADQVVTASLIGGELVRIEGMSPDGVLEFALPAHRLRAMYLLDRRHYSLDMHLDTVLIHPDDRHVVMVWHAGFRCDKKALRVREVRIALDLVSPR